MDVKEIEINNCYACPFSNCDNEAGYDICNLAENLNINLGIDTRIHVRETLPNHKRHDKCPLNQFEIKITVT